MGRTKTNRTKIKSLAPKIGSDEFKALKKLWYDKLEATGFQDIEYAEGPIVDQMLKYKASGNLKNQLGKSIYEYYFLLRNFLTHNKGFWSSVAKGKVNRRFIIESYAEGLTYREIANQSKKLRTPFSFYTAFQVVKEFIPIAIEWNKTHPLGHSNCNSDMDFYLEDFLLKDEESNEGEE